MVLDPEMPRIDLAERHDADRGFKRITLVGMGLAGGLVPSPSALVVLLGCIGFGHTAFGILLVITYGLGMATTLMAVGYLLARMPHRVGRLRERFKGALISRLIDNGPILTACLVVVVGIGVVVKSGLTLHGFAH